MTDPIRSRHVLDEKWPNAAIQRCAWCYAEWPCDAIREADRADAAQVVLFESQAALIREGMERDAARAELAALHAVNIEWWVCAWCDARFPYSDGPDTLKAHSATCPSHPAVADAKALAEALDLLRSMHFDAGDGTCDDCGEDMPCPTLTMTDPALAAHKEATR